MAPRIPGDNNVEDDQEDDVSQEQIEDDQDGDEGQGDDVGAEDEAETGPDSEVETRGRPEGDGRRRVLEGRRESPLAKANRLAQEARTEADRVARELADFRAEQQQRSRPPQETPEQEEARLALMEPAERSEYRFNKQMRAQNEHLARMQFQMQDTTDRAEFARISSANPLYKKVAAKVETELATIRRQGQNIEREKLAAYLIGKEILERGPKVVETRRNEGQRRIEQQRTRPSAGRSDQGSEDRRRTSLRDRLADVVF